MTAWDDTLRQLARYPSAVLSAVDEAGYPASFRCQPSPDAAARVLRVRLPDALGLQAGPASLMSHSHDEQLWNLKGFLVRGRLDIDGDAAVFRTEKFVLTAGGGSMDTLRMLRGCRRAAAGYLARRGLSRPSIPWSRIKDAQHRAAAR